MRGGAFFSNRFAASALLAAAVLGACREQPSGVFGSGVVEATELTIAARTPGELISVNVEEGVHVTRGQILARIDPADLELELRQGGQRVESAEAQLDLLLAGARSEDLSQAEAQLDLAREAFDLTSLTYTRAQRLYQSGSTTTSDLDRARTENEQARARVASAEAQLRKLQSMARPQEIRVARARVEEAKAAVARIERRLEETRIRAPRAGTITTEVRETGEYVSPGAALFTLADLSSVRLTIYIPEPDLASVRLGQSAEVRVDGLPDRRFEGRISRIAQEAEFTPKTVQTSDARAQLVYAIDISLQNPEGVFKIGMPADAWIRTDR